MTAIAMDTNKQLDEKQQSIKSKMQAFIEDILPSWPQMDQQLFREKYLLQHTDQQIGDARGWTTYTVERQLKKLLNRILTQSVHSTNTTTSTAGE